MGVLCVLCVCTRGHHLYEQPLLNRIVGGRHRWIPVSTDGSPRLPLTPKQQEKDLFEEAVVFPFTIMATPRLPVWWYKSFLGCLASMVVPKLLGLSQLTLLRG